MCSIIWTRKVSGSHKEHLRGKSESFMDVCAIHQYWLSSTQQPSYGAWNPKSMFDSRLDYCYYNWEDVGSARPKQPTITQSYAFIDGDFPFLDKNCSPLKGRARETATFVRIHWWTQRHKNNGDTKLFAVAKDDQLCPVGAAWCTQARFERLRSVFPVLGISTEGCITA